MTFSANDYHLTKGSLLSGHTIQVVCSGEIYCNDDIYDGYTTLNRVDFVTIYDKNGVDVTSDYNVTREDGILTVVSEEE